MAASPFSVNVHDLMHKPGQMREFELDVRLAEAMGNGGVEVDFQELFAYSYTSEDELVVVDETVDLHQPVLDAVVLNLPFQPICSPDCLGLCPDCGIRMAEDPTHKHEAAIDSRWTELKNFKED